jgi:hypothetical protein
MTPSISFEPYWTAAGQLDEISLRPLLAPMLTGD